VITWKGTLQADRQKGVIAVEMGARDDGEGAEVETELGAEVRSGREGCLWRVGDEKGPRGEDKTEMGEGGWGGDEGEGLEDVEERGGDKNV
jgi:hypothetical protein